MGRVNKRNQTQSTTTPRRPTINHPSHPQHMLHPTPQSAGPSDVVIKCKACSRRVINEWSYRCLDCNVDYTLHSRCANKPIQLNHIAHPACPLDLIFHNPYPDSDDQEFTCDVCDQPGSTADQWFYQCDSASHDKFYTHLDCPPTNIHTITNPGMHTQPGNQHRPPQILLGAVPLVGNQNVHYPRPQGHIPVPYDQYAMTNGYVQGNIPVPYDQYGYQGHHIPQYGMTNGFQGHAPLVNPQNRYHPYLVRPQRPLMPNVQPTPTTPQQIVQGLTNGAAQQMGQHFMNELLNGTFVPGIDLSQFWGGFSF